MRGERKELKRKKVLAALPFFGEVISGHRQLRLKGNQDAKLISVSEVLRINETAGEGVR